MPDVYSNVQFVSMATILYRIGGLFSVMYKFAFFFLLRYYRKWLLGDLAKVLFHGQKLIIDQ